MQARQIAVPARWASCRHTDPDRITQWWTQWPDAGIGINCKKSGIVVIDVDNPSAFEDYLEERNLEVPKTTSVNTSGGGQHLYLRARPGAAYLGKLCSGVDIKHDGYVIAPPCRSYSKRTGATGAYTWVEAGESTGIAPAPIWLPEKTTGTLPTEAPAAPIGADKDVYIPEIEELLDHFPPSDEYCEWLTVLSAIAQATGKSEQGRAIAESRSRRGSKFKDGEVDRRWDGLPESCADPMSLIASRAKQAGADVSEIRHYHTVVRNGDLYKIDGKTMDLSELLASASDPSVAPSPTVARDDGIDTSADYSADAQPAVPSSAVDLRCQQLEKRAINASLAEPSLSSDYLIKGLLLRITLCVLYGPPGGGKTFLALDIANHIASGQSWNGHRVQEGLVIYFSAEGVSGIQNRLVALGEGRSENLIVVPVPVDLYSSEVDAMAIIAMAKRAAGEKPIAMIVVDTLARSFGNGDENIASDMSTVVNRCDDIREALNATVLLVHHTGKDADRGARGSSALKGAVDTEMLVQKKNGQAFLSVEKQRSLAGHMKVSFDLEPIVLGTDADGDEVTSCKVVYKDGDHSDAIFLGPKQKWVLEQLKSFARSHGTSGFEGGHTDTISVDRKSFVEDCVTKANTARKAALRSVTDALSSLVSKGAVCEDADRLFVSGTEC